MNAVTMLFHALCFSDKPLPWYMTVLKCVLYAVLLSVMWAHNAIKFVMGKFNV